MEGSNICAGCVFYDGRKFEELVEFSEMIMIDGFKDHLFNEWCIDDNVYERFEKYGGSVNTDELITWYKIANKYEERSFGIIDLSYPEMNMKERCEFGFNRDMMNIMSSGLRFETLHL